MGTIYKIYCDESRQTGSTFKLMGGLWIPKNLGWDFVNEFHKKCLDNTGCLPAHMKWTKVPNDINGKYFSHYLTLIDLFFDYNKRYHQQIFFKTIIVDKNYKFDHKVYNQGDPEIGFYKLYYFLILSTLSEENLYHLRIASRNVSKKKIDANEADRLKDLRKCLNAGYCKKTNYQFFKDLVISVESRPAKERRLIQLVDILMGAVGYHWNKLHLEKNAKKPKVHLAEYIASKLGRKDLCFETNSSDRVFNIFRLRTDYQNK